ncbi:hypothetical protein SADUNF_Sadunf09G0118700 [Salix dunnii]|uniref:60S acidic ribosomal protein P2 n=1 Tax=Salix dunnii TaxID=1413687 RepID=A0A835JRV6_9ROSI|nr:hypothetical protein SADUNF_Sadunf09G0118700 [Salix dunnii]
MKVVAAYLLAVLGGNTCPTAEDLKNILGSVGADADDDRIELLLSSVKGKDITELIASGYGLQPVRLRRFGFQKISKRWDLVKTVQRSVKRKREPCHIKCPYIIPYYEAKRTGEERELCEGKSLGDVER